MKNNNQASAIVIVVLSAVLIGAMTASILTLANSQRRMNLRKELQLQANNAAEASADYAYSFLINEIKVNALAGAPSVPSSGSKSFTIPSASLAFLTDALPAPPNFSGPTTVPTIYTPEVKVLAPTAPVRFLVDPKDPANANDPNINQWVIERTVPVIAKVTVTQGSDSATAYVRKGVSVREIYLFQHAIFFSGQLQLHRGYHPLGDVHSNGPLLINAHSDDVATYTGFISTASKFYRGSTIDDGGRGGDAYGYTRIIASGELDTLSGYVVPHASNTDKLTIFTGKTGNTDNYAKLDLTFDSRMTNWKDKATEIFINHLKDQSHSSPSLTPIGSSGYQLDVASTTAINEFNNGPYSLIEPLLPAGHAARKTAQANDLNLEAVARLILRVEVRRDLLRTVDPDLSATTAPTGVVRLYASTNPTGRAVVKSGVAYYPSVLTPINTVSKKYTAADLKLAGNITDAFVVKAYMNSGDANALSLTPVTLPPGVVGAANASITAIAGGSLGPGAGTYQIATASGNGVFEPYKGPIRDADVTKSGSSAPFTFTYAVPSTKTISSGLHDPRLGRGVDLLTINVGQLKWVMEQPIASLTGDNLLFRQQFTNWRGVIYVEFPTSLDIDYSPAHLDDDLTPPHPNTDPKRNTLGPYDSYSFLPGSAELRHPDRWADTDNLSRADRTDRIVPIAPQLRRYPGSFTDKDIANRFYAIPALQLINAKALPNPTGSLGFTVATNAPLYLVGSYNSDGDYATGTNVTATAADAYATNDPGEVSAALFSDTFTILSDSWPTNRANSFYGAPGDSNTYRKVPKDGTKRIEIGACIATGEYPIFEFFTHALEDYVDFNSGSPVVNPIIVKGSMVGMFHSEIQHIKQAYGRVKENDIQVYWNAHGANAFTSVRYHQSLMNGTFPPGTPRAQVTYQVGYRLLRTGDADDRADLTAAGFGL